MHSSIIVNFFLQGLLDQGKRGFVKKESMILVPQKNWKIK